VERHQQLTSLLEGLGASFVGFSNVAGKTGDSLKALNYAVTVGVRLSDAIIDEITDKPTYTYFHHYRTVNALLDQIALRGLLFIQQQGFRAIAVPASQTVNDANDPYSGIFPHKTAAVLAGLGCIGKNGLFLHNEFGPRVRLATILTDMEVPCPVRESSSVGDGSEGNPKGDFAGDGSSKKGYCSDCSLCVAACPAMALTGREWHEDASREEIVDAQACSNYMNNKFKHIGRGSVCGICIKVCRAGKRQTL